MKVLTAVKNTERILSIGSLWYGKVICDIDDVFVIAINMTKVEFLVMRFIIDNDLNYLVIYLLLGFAHKDECVFGSKNVFSGIFLNK